MQLSPMIELMPYPFAVPLVTLLYTAVHILPVNLTRLYIFRHYLRFSPQPIAAAQELLARGDVASIIVRMNFHLHSPPCTLIFFVIFIASSQKSSPLLLQQEGGCCLSAAISLVFAARLRAVCCFLCITLFCFSLTRPCRP